ATILGGGVGLQVPDVDVAGAAEEPEEDALFRAAGAGGMRLQTEQVRQTEPQRAEADALQQVSPRPGCVDEAPDHAALLSPTWWHEWRLPASDFGSAQGGWGRAARARRRAARNKGCPVHFDTCENRPQCPHRMSLTEDTEDDSATLLRS